MHPSLLHLRLSTIESSENRKGTCQQLKSPFRGQSHQGVITVIFEKRWPSRLYILTLFKQSMDSISKKEQHLNLLKIKHSLVNRIFQMNVFQKMAVSFVPKCLIDYLIIRLSSSALFLLMFYLFSAKITQSKTP